MERRKHWWNGSWGRLTRRDVYLWEDGGRWLVEARRGGAEGHSNWAEYPDADAALDAVRNLFDPAPGWREL